MVAGESHVNAGSSPEDMTLASAQREVDVTIIAQGGYWSPLANLARLFEECGELARAINQSYGSKLVKPGEPPAAVREELGDALYVLLVLANSLHLSASEALQAAFAKAYERAGLRAHESDSTAT
jgi:NTP pyrophosphatase (non-canonical NTP hydrolase)